MVTQGIFEFLSEEEQRPVVAHELGHIVNRDFILMTMAGMLVQILYQLYAMFARSQRSSSSKEGNKLAVIGLVALVGYYIGIYSCSISAAPANIWPMPSPPTASSPSILPARSSRSPMASSRSRIPRRHKACSGARGISAWSM
ncbi:MAG: M48 family metalloprotease [Methyloceanibacter sp.]